MYRDGNGQVNPTDLNTKFCTHMVYQYANLLSYAAISTKDLESNGLRQFVNLRNDAPWEKIMVSVGGPQQSSAVLSSIMSIVSLRKAAVLSITSLVNDYNLDGIDIYWRFPVLNGGNPVDRENFITFLTLLNESLKTNGKLLTISVAPTKDYFMSSYDVPKLSSIVDYVNVMAFDLRAYWNGKTGFNSPAYPSSAEPSLDETELNVDKILRGWIEAGLTSSKIILGVSTEGHSFKLASTFATGLWARTIGTGTEGIYTTTDGVLNYLEICELIGKGGWTVYWSNTQKAHYAYKGDQWVSYESIPSLEAKILLSKQYKVAGLGMWAVEGDDVRNVCGQGTFPLLTFVGTSLGISNREDELPTTTAATTTTVKTTAATTPSATTAAPTGLPAICPSSGFVRDPTNCAKFYRCVIGAPFAILASETCKEGLYFDTRYNVCNWKSVVTC